MPAMSKAHSALDQVQTGATIFTSIRFAGDYTSSWHIPEDMGLQ